MRTREPASAAAAVVAAGALPEGPRLNVGSGPRGRALDQHRRLVAGAARRSPLARARRLAVFGIEIGHWPRGIKCRNVRRGLGFDDESIAVVYASHLLEHLYREEALRFLRDVRRALVPGGVCRIVVPDVAAIVGWYLAHQREPAEQRTQPSSNLLMGLLLLRPDRPSGTGLVALRAAVGRPSRSQWMYDQEGCWRSSRKPGSWTCRREAISTAPSLAMSSRRSSAPIALCGGAGVCVEARK